MHIEPLASPSVNVPWPIHIRNCKFCEKEIHAKADPECSQEDVNVLLVMLACNDCADARRRKNDAFWNISRICGQISRINMESGGSVTNDRGAAYRVKRDVYRTQLENQCRVYMQAVAKSNGTRWVQGVEELVSQLLDQPGTWAGHLNWIDRNFKKFYMDMV